MASTRVASSSWAGLGHELLERVLVVGVPARERGSALHQVSGGPENALLCPARESSRCPGTECRTRRSRCPRADVRRPARVSRRQGASAGRSARSYPCKVKPGTSRWAVTLPDVFSRSVCARPSVNDFTPDLLTLYAVSPGGCVMPCLEPVLITSPGLSPSTMAGTKRCTPCMTPIRFTPSTRRQPSGFESASPPPPVPALFMTTETCPNRSSTVRASRSTDPASETSVTWARTRSPSPMSSSARFSFSSSRSARQTRKPSSTSRFAVASPIPLAEPVTTAVLPVVRAG